MGKLGIYLMANYPSRDAFLEGVKICRRRNVDFLEIGLPFSDPVADGESLEKASWETMEHYGSADCFRSFREGRDLFGGRVYLMTYGNVVFGMGMDRFAEETGPMAGLILADVPAREARCFEKGLGRHEMGLIRFLSPESRKEEIERAVRVSRDFIYFVSKRGTTGGGFFLDQEARSKIALARDVGGDIYVGFGIRSKDDVARAFEVADGAIIGTGAIEALKAGTEHFDSYIGRLRG